MKLLYDLHYLPIPRIILPFMQARIGWLWHLW